MNPFVYLTSQDAGLLKHWQTAWGAGYQILSSPQAQLNANAVLVIDLAHPALASWSDTHWREQCSALPVIVCNTHPSDDEAHRLLSLGARGYCHAAAPLELLRQVMSVVASGEIWAGRALVQRILAAINHLPAAKPSLAQLSERERETAIYAAQGLANKEIARRLGISDRTVKAHLSSCYEKLAIGDRVQLTLRVNGLM